MHRADDGARQAAQTTDDRGDEALDDQASQRGIQCIFDAQEHACHTGQQAGDDKCELDDPGRIDPHKLSRVPVERNSAQCAAQTCFLNHIAKDDQRRQADDAHHGIAGRDDQAAHLDGGIFEKARKVVKV